MSAVFFAASLYLPQFMTKELLPMMATFAVTSFAALVPGMAVLGVGLGVNTAIVTASASLVDGIRDAFLLDAVLAFCALVVSMLFVGGSLRGSRPRS